MLAVRRALNGDWTGGRGLISAIANELPDSRVRDRLLELDSLDSSEPVMNVARRFGNSGYVVESVPLALFAAQQISGASNFAGWLRSIIEAGGDTDTIASMAGQVAGCVIGYSCLPQELLARLPDREILQQAVEAFARRIVQDA